MAERVDMILVHGFASSSTKRSIFQNRPTDIPMCKSSCSKILYQKSTSSIVSTVKSSSEHGYNHMTKYININK